MCRHSHHTAGSNDIGARREDERLLAADDAAGKARQRRE